MDLPPIPGHLSRVACWARCMFVVGPHLIRWYPPMACGRRCFGGGGGGGGGTSLRGYPLELSGKLAWLSVALKTSVRLLMMRALLFVLKAFVTVEDFRFPETMSVFSRRLVNASRNGGQPHACFHVPQTRPAGT